MNLRLAILATIAVLGISRSGNFYEDKSSKIAPANTTPQASVSKGVAFSCQDTEATIKAKGGPSVAFGTANIYIGYAQVSSNNKNPRLIRFDKGVKTWCREDYEMTGDDGTGYGLMWDGSKTLYTVFSSTGSQGKPSQDFRRFAAGGWLSSYGSGGGAKVAVLAKVDPSNGNVQGASFLTGVKGDGKTNSLLVDNLSWNGSQVVVKARSWFSPRRANKSAMSCSGSSPFNYTLRFTPDLKVVSDVAAQKCR